MMPRPPILTYSHLLSPTLTRVCPLPFIRIITTTNGNEKPPATNVFVLAADPTSRRQLNGAEDLRWEVTSNTGASAAAGGIPSGVNYVTRTQAEGGAPPRSCDAGETIKSQYSAAYNVFSCDEAYLAQAPAAGPIASAIVPKADALAPARAPVQAPAVTVVPVVPVIPVPAPTAEVPVATPISIPPVAVAPIAPMPATVALPPVVSIPPATAPESSASTYSMYAASGIALAGLAYLA